MVGYQGKLVWGYDFLEECLVLRVIALGVLWWERNRTCGFLVKHRLEFNIFKLPVLHLPEW